MKVPPQRERAEIENALRSGAEDRLPEARTLLLNIDEAVRHKLECVPTGVGTSLFGWGGESNEPRYVSNHDKVLPARAAIADAVAELAGLELAAVSYSEVSMALSEMFERLAKPLGRVELNPPQMDNEGQIAQPLRWNGRPAWLVDELMAAEKPDPVQPKASPNARRLTWLRSQS